MVSHRLLNLLPHVFVSTSKQNHLHQLDIDGKSALLTFHLHIFSPKIMAVGLFLIFQKVYAAFSSQISSFLLSQEFLHYAVGGILVFIASIVVAVKSYGVSALIAGSVSAFLCLQYVQCVLLTGQGNAQSFLV